MIEAVPVLSAVGVKVALRLSPLPLIADSAPPDTVMSPSSNPVGASVKVKVMVAVSPDLRKLTLLEMAMAESTVSTDSVLVSSTNALPAASVMVLATVKTRSSVLSSAAVT